MDGSIDCNIEWNKSGREKQMSYDSAYMWNLKIGTNELIYKTEIALEI